MVWECLLLYIFLFISLVNLVIAKSIHRTLTILIFGEIFVALLVGFSRNGASPLLSAFVLAVFTSITVVFFDAEYTGLRERDVKSRDVGLPLLVTLMAIVLFYRAGIIASILIGYLGVYLACLFYFESKKIPDVQYRRYYYLLKLPCPLLAPLALVEQFGLVVYLVPLIVLHYLITVLWLKIEFPQMIKPPRIT
ncbi:hypothetical protein [Thermococcus sp.]|uniref:hypothetical protein n=1 Tax=Thermococcus sp. TaxID=35749 RepID=UPI00260F9E9D|nr:hypothetical protein [Thermococcus sp.]